MRVIARGRRDHDWLLAGGEYESMQANAGRDDVLDLVVGLR